MDFINDLGVYGSLAEVWDDYPNGGLDGDYVTINSTPYGWNKYNHQWEANNYNSSAGTQTRRIDGNMSVARDLYIGGIVYAKGIQYRVKGLVESAEALRALFPDPQVGDWAIVGDNIPGEIFMCKQPGVWTGTGKQGGGGDMDLTAYRKTTDEAIYNISALFPNEGYNHTNAYTLKLAVDRVAEEWRKPGLRVMFKDTDGKWRQYQFQHDNVKSWNVYSFWVSAEDDYHEFKEYQASVNEKQEETNTAYDKRITSMEDNFRLLGIAKTYPTLADMNADESPIDSDGLPLKTGALVCVNGEEAGEDRNKVYKWLNPGWEYMYRIEGAPTDNALSETSQNPVQNRVVTAAIIELQNANFPLSATLGLSSSLLEYTGKEQSVKASWNIRRKNQDKTPTVLVLKQDDATLPTTLAATGNVTASVNKKGTTTFSLHAEADVISANASRQLTMVLTMYFGIAADGLADITTLVKQAIKTSPVGSYKINNPSSGQYLWLCVPDDKSINSVKSSGFDVPMEEPVVKKTALGSYKCYRSSGKPNAGDMSFTIN